MPAIISCTITALIIILIIVLSRLRKKRHRERGGQKYAEWRGNAGESIVARVLDKIDLEPKILINNYIIEEEGRTRQIDHILVNCNGVFVIETKTLSGKILGKENWKEWRQFTDYGSSEHVFYNPVKQNFTHMFCIKKLLPQGTPIFNIVVFADGDISNVDSSHTVSIDKLKPAILNTHYKNLLSEEEIQGIGKVLEDNRSQVTVAEHIRSVETMREEIAAGRCPRCKGKLVLRHGPYGDFYGCSNYPKCEFKKNIEG